MKIEPTDWTCPFCNRNQVITDDNYDRGFTFLPVGNSIHGLVGIAHAAIRCSSPECNDVTLLVSLAEARDNRFSEWTAGNLIQNWSLRPESASKVQPDYIPGPLREDYYEACLIRDKSPKAAATLARRCLQGMIRDFCGISKSRLIEEISELKRLIDDGAAPKGVQPEAVDAIDAIRSIGNIGAHMERDINLIVDVDPGEAQALIELIEMLFDEWYVARHKRDQRLARVQAIAAEKKAEIAQAKAALLPPPSGPSNSA